MNEVFDSIINNGVSFYLESFSALDRYFNIKKSKIYYLLTDASLVNLAEIFDELEYPGLIFIDAILNYNGKKYYFRCVDEINKFPALPFTAQNLLYNVKDKSYFDPYGIYKDLRRDTLIDSDSLEFSWLTVMTASKLISRYHYDIDIEQYINYPSNKKIKYVPLEPDQKELLVSILTSSNTERGLDLLLRSGFIEEFWPELYEMQNIEHSKEFHPEGNVWEHTLEALKHRKDYDLTLTMALLLHDVGKTIASGPRAKPFAEHAELGVKISNSFLRRLGFSSDFIDDVSFLIRYHMLPAALNELPIYRMEKALKHPLFPLLLEVYRADTSATFRGPEGYYNACRIYRKYLKTRGNPYKVIKKSNRVMH